MKFLKFVGKTLIVLLILNLLIISIFWIRNQDYKGSKNDENIAYLKANHKVISDNSNEYDFTNFFNKDFYDSKIFLLGENHGFAETQSIDLELFKHLHKTIGVKYYLAEMDSVCAKKLNSFLNKASKDTALLKQIVIDIKQRIPQQSGKQLYNKWSKLYDYNHKFKQTEKITVLGIDKDFDDESTAISRDSIMILNFQNIIKDKNIENEKFYGFFGFAHVLQEAYGETQHRSFAARLKRSYPKNKIKTFVCYNIDSEVYFPKNDQYPSPSDGKTKILNEDGPIMLVKCINDLKVLTKANSVTLFNLNSEDSPYHSSKYLSGIKVNFFGGDALSKSPKVHTTDVLQYVFLIRNSKAITPIVAQ